MIQSETLFLPRNRAVTATAVMTNRQRGTYLDKVLLNGR